MASDSSDGIDYNRLADKIIDRAVATGMTRREVVSAIAGAGAAGTAVALMSDKASAQDSLVIDGVDQIGRDGDRVQTLYVENIDNYTSSETFDSVTVNNSLDAGSISTGSLTLTPLAEEVQTFAGGETKNRNPAGDVKDANRLIVSAAPNNVPGNDHGYTVDSVFYDSSSDRVKVRVTETENEGGGEARLVYYEIKTP